VRSGVGLAVAGTRNESVPAKRAVPQTSLPVSQSQAAVMPNACCCNRPPAGITAAGTVSGGPLVTVLNLIDTYH